MKRVLHNMLFADTTRFSASVIAFLRAFTAFFKKTEHHATDAEEDHSCLLIVL
jgi:hypothetical protein